MFGAPQLNHTQVDAGVNLSVLAQVTEGYSGSDLHELCRNALMIALREVMHSHNADSEVCYSPD